MKTLIFKKFGMGLSLCNGLYLFLYYFLVCIMLYEDRECKKHGLTKFKQEKYAKDKLKWRCVKCGFERCNTHKRKIKNKLVIIHGGKCVICGYNKYCGSLDFHHLNPLDKEDKISQYRTYKKSLEESKKCILVCKNCHGEIEAGLINLDGVCSVMV